MGREKSTTASGQPGYGSGSAADLTHRPVGPYEVDLADPVPGPLRAPPRPSIAAREPVVEIGFVETAPARNTTRRSVSSSANRHVRNCALRRDAHTIAVVAERFTHARDHADVADAVAEHETLRRFDVVGIAGLEREHRVDAIEDLLRGNDFVADSTPLARRGA